MQLFTEHPNIFLNYTEPTEFDNIQDPLFFTQNIKISLTCDECILRSSELCQTETIMFQ